MFDTGGAAVPKIYFLSPPTVYGHTSVISCRVCLCVRTGADVRCVFESVTAHCLPTQLKIPSHGPLTEAAHLDREIRAAVAVEKLLWLPFILESHYKIMTRWPAQKTMQEIIVG